MFSCVLVLQFILLIAFLFLLVYWYYLNVVPIVLLSRFIPSPLFCSKTVFSIFQLEHDLLTHGQTPSYTEAKIRLKLQNKQFWQNIFGYKTPFLWLLVKKGYFAWSVEHKVKSNFFSKKPTPLLWVAISRLFFIRF